MGIGTSKGAFYRDEGHYQASQWDDKYDDNVITPQDLKTRKDLDAAELNPTTGLGIEIKDQMPFPNNNDPRTDFDFRFPKELPPSGILNDLKKPTGETRPLVRKISMSGEDGNSPPPVDDLDIPGVVRGPQMRNPANDNDNLQIETPVYIEDAIDDSWKSLIDKHRRGIEIKSEQARLLQIQLEREFNDIEKAKYNKLKDEYSKLFP